MLKNFSLFITVFCFASPCFAKKKATTQELFHQYLNLSSFRHQILTENIANANTPGYKANEVEMPKNFEELASVSKHTRGVELKRTSSRHLGGSRQVSKFKTKKLEDPFEIKPNGNNVSIPQQVTKVSQNQTNYEKVLKAYENTNSLTAAALGK